jgi:signal peptidase
LDEINREFAEARFLDGNHNRDKPSYPNNTDELRQSSGEFEAKVKVSPVKQLKVWATKEKNCLLTGLSDILFYVAIFVILFSALASGGNGVPKVMMGYSFFTVQTSSMQDEIPKGSFIIVKQTAAEELRVGENITFLRERGPTVTHKIIDIYENYQNKGVRGFQTQGVNNANPDTEIVSEENIVGKVMFIIPGLGPALSYLSARIHLVLIIFVLFVVISFSLRGIFGKPREEKDKDLKRTEIG